MSAPRHSLISILDNEFKKSPTQKDTALRTAKGILEKHPELASRIFDKFPYLISTELEEELTKEFRDIFLSLNNSSIRVSDEGAELIKDIDKNRISAWEKKIASMGVTELLNDEGYIKNEIIRLFEWENFKPQLKSISLTWTIVCAYVGAVNQMIMKNLGEEGLFLEQKEDKMQDQRKYGVINSLMSMINHFKTPLKRHFIASAVYSFINKNCRAWVRNRIVNRLLYQLDASGYIVTSPDIQNEKYERLSYENILFWPVHKQDPGIYIAVGAVNLAASRRFFRQYQAQNSETEMVTLPKLK